MRIVWTCAIYTLLTVSCVTLCLASRGDSSQVFRRCVTWCQKNNCNKTTAQHFHTSQPVFERIFGWDCTDECRYSCMWKTVQSFKSSGHDVPQFYGKWPFVRFLGMQEPASAIFSILNGLAHLDMYLRFRQKVPISAPMYHVWTISAFMAINAWTWSAIFHTRDFPLTEILDYACAVSGVLYCFFGLCARVVGTKQPWKLTVIGLLILAFFSRHVYFLTFVRFDYGYNMKVNVLVGAVNSTGWLIWYLINRRKLPYAWKCAVVVILVNVLLLLEVGDFPPLFWIFDAHSLWHLGTAPLAYLWYSFVIEDCLHLNEKTYRNKTVFD